jgi:fluoride exporter
VTNAYRTTHAVGVISPERAVYTGGLHPLLMASRYSEVVSGVKYLSIVASTASKAGRVRAGPDIRHLTYWPWCSAGRISASRVATSCPGALQQGANMSPNELHTTLQSSKARRFPLFSAVALTATATLAVAETGPYFWIAVGSAIGGVARYWLSGVVARLVGETFPWGTLLINVGGSFVIGFFGTLTGPDGRVFVGSTGRQFVMVGICGGFTTFSSFSLQTLNLLNDGEWLYSGSYVAASVVLCLMAVWAGYALAISLSAGKLV